MQTRRWTYGLYVLLIGCIARGQVVRDFITDEFYESDKLKCNDKRSSYKTPTGMCRCDHGRSFFYHQNKNCHTREEIIDVSGGCTEGFVTMDTKSIQIVNSCRLKDMIKLEKWEYENDSSYWRPGKELQKDLSVENGEHGIKIDPTDGNWDGLLLKLTFQCYETDNMQRCMLIKLTGKRQYSLTSLSSNTTKSPQLTNKSTRSPTTTTTEFTTTGSASATTATLASQTLVTTKSQKVFVDETSTKTQISTTSMKTDNVISVSKNIAKTSKPENMPYLNEHQSSILIAKITVGITLSVILSIIAIGLVVFIRQKIEKYQNNRASDIEENIEQNITTEQNISLTMETDNQIPIKQKGWN